MRVSAHWSTQQLAEFVTEVSTAEGEADALSRAVEQVVEALEADVAAVVRGGVVLASIGWPRVEVPEPELVAAAADAALTVPVPGYGPAQPVVVELGCGDDGHLLLVRCDDPLEPSEALLVRGMARTLALTLRLVGTADAERSLRLRSERQARDNARLLGHLQDRQRLMEGLATIQRAISHRQPLEDVLDAVVRTAGELLGDPRARVIVHEPARDALAARAMDEGRLIVAEGSRADRVGMAAPVHEQGELVGALSVGSVDRARTWSRADQEMLSTLAEHASLALTDAKTVGAMLHQALHDALTGLPNRALFLDRLRHALARSERGTGSRPRSRVGVLFLDLDRFKAVNDSLGHAAGDELLVAVAARIGECLRMADTAARLGGDEFAILLEDVRDSAEAVVVAERIIEALRPPFSVGGREVFVAASVGVVCGHGSGEELLRNADVAMYRAKGEGKGRHALFEPSMRAEVVERLELEADLRRAVLPPGVRRGPGEPSPSGDLEVHYQPIVRISDGGLSGFEALVRWRHPQRGLVPPLHFIPLAEETELIMQIGAWVLDEAVRQVVAWGPEAPRSITVNLSGRQLEEPGLVEQVEGVLLRHGLEPSRLVLEITETVLMQDTEATVARLTELRALGVRLAVDDFGTGYSSLRYLQGFPVDLLKMAKEFVDGVASTDEGRALARTIVELGRSLGLDVVAEGIEHDEQHAALRRLGCQLGQGYLFAKPLPVAEAQELILVAASLAAAA